MVAIFFCCAEPKCFLEPARLQLLFDLATKVLLFSKQGCVVLLGDGMQLRL
jgi:hypothetical protein